MKRAAALLVAFALVAAAPAAGSSRKTTYTGSIDPSGDISLTTKTVKKKHKKKKVTLIDFSFAAMPLDCDTGPETTSGSLSFKQRIKDGKLRIDAVIGSSQNPDSRLTVRGHVGKRTASGTIRVSGIAVPVDGGGTAACDSGKLDWSASK